MQVEYRFSNGLVPYEEALAAMEARVEAIAAGEKPPLLWFLEHPPLYTAGTSAKEGDLLDAGGFPVYRAGRGGEYTYHGPGQRVGYVMMPLADRPGCKGKDIRCYVRDLEQWIILALKDFGIEGNVREGRVGVWVETPTGEAKIAALGVRVRKWVSFHGIALNVQPELSHFGGIVPCGIKEFGVTSLQALGITASMAEVDESLKRAFAKVFDATLMGT
ncbi:lipoyl(octanoyl) transferase LipB [bacterium]|nr:lipoyl(octanoyl) transferase LipB [bacterium]